MKNSLQDKHIELINLAVKEGLGVTSWELATILKRGLTDALVYKIKVLEQKYVIKLEDPNDKNFNLDRNYEIVRNVSNQGIAPRVHFLNSKNVERIAIFNM